MASRGLREGYEPLITALGGGVLDFRAMLAIADALPVMIAYFDRDCATASSTSRSPNGSSGRAREILGRASREIIGDEAFDASASR